MQEEKEKKYIMLKRLEIPFSDYIRVAEKTRVKPYRKDKCRVPKKYQTEDYGWNSKGFLIRKSDGIIITANSKTAGKPREKKVSGQDIYNGHISSFARAFLVRSLHQRFAPFVRELEAITSLENFPLGVHLNFHVHDKGKNNLDNDNRWIWEKALQDTLVEHKIIPDDNPYIVWENVKRTILIAPEKEQSLVIEIYGYA